MASPGAYSQTSTSMPWLSIKQGFNTPKVEPPPKPATKPTLNSPKAPPKQDGPPAVIPGFKPSTAKGSTPAVFEYEKALNLLNAQGNINTTIQKLESDAAKYAADVQASAMTSAASTQADATKFAASAQAGAMMGVATTQAGATKYVADKELESALGVENIRSKGAIDLQGIINAGAANVENIRGEYNIKGKKVDRSTAILGGLVSAFNF